MQRSASLPLLRSLRSHNRNFSSSSSDNNSIFASVLFERLPVVVPKIDPVVYAFQEFSLRWQQQYRRRYPDEVLGKADARGKGDYQIDYAPAPRITDADKQNNRRMHCPFIAAGLIDSHYYTSHEHAKSLQRALDRRLYLLLYGTPDGSSGKKPVWHFPEKVYENEETLRLCAESALKSVLGELHHTYFVGNAPLGHMIVGQTDGLPEGPSFKRFFFKSQVIGTNKLSIGKCEDYVWVTKDELMEYFPEQASFFNKMIIS